MTDPLIPATPSPAGRSWASVLPFALSCAVMHTVLWAICIGVLLFYVPKTERIFRDFNMTLPTATLAVFSIARWVANYWYILVLWFPLGFACDAGLLAVLYRWRRRMGWAWGLLNAVLPLLFIAFVFIAIESTKARLLEGLNR